MISKIYSASLKGLSAQIIEIEIALAKGLRSFNIVGLADRAIEEAKERIGAAIKNIGLSPPRELAKKIVVNLAPADLKKEGSLYDLPIALNYLLVSRQTKFNPRGKIILGELALDGTLKPIKGAISFALLAQEKGFPEIILPKENEKEASLVGFLKNKEKLKIVGVENLKEALSYLEGKKEISSRELKFSDFNNRDTFEIEFSWIKGQKHAKRALEIAAAGGHNILFQGPPGAGKTLLAKSIISILPKLNLKELLELAIIYSASGISKKNFPFLIQRPFRSPHHTISEIGLIGGSNPPTPGEITLSHRGVLFLDEFPEFRRDTLESLRAPLEEGEINIKRANYNLTFPSRFTLIAAANPCPCGYFNDPEKECTCTPSQIVSYRRKLSGPLMDRFDIFCWIPSLKYNDLISPDREGQSIEVKKRVEKAREIQKERFKEEMILTNSEMKIPQIKKYCQIDSKSQNILRKYVDSARLSARGYHRVLKVARTIADLDEKKNISFENVSEALIYRLRENN